MQKVQVYGCLALRGAIPYSFPQMKRNHHKQEGRKTVRAEVLDTCSETTFVRNGIRVAHKLKSALVENTRLTGEHDRQNLT